MAKSKSRVFRMTPKFLIISLIVLGGLVYSLYKVVPRALNTVTQVPQIDVISNLEYGPVELDGYLQKDTPVGEEGNYYLSTESGNYVNLVIEGDIDAMLGTKVRVTGILGAPAVEGGKPLLVVDTMQTTE